MGPRDGFFGRSETTTSLVVPSSSTTWSPRLAPVVPEGTYFVMARTGAWGELSDRDFCRWLTTEVGVAIPPSAFMTDPQTDTAWPALPSAI